MSMSSKAVAGEDNTIERGSHTGLVAVASVNPLDLLLATIYMHRQRYITNEITLFTFFVVNELINADIDIIFVDTNHYLIYI